MKRYFIISYSHSRGFGQMDIITYEGRFPSKKTTTKQVSESGVTEVIILNIIEVTEDEFVNWID